MERSDGIEETPAGPSTGSLKSRPGNRADPFLVVCRCFSVVTSLIATLCVVVNVLAAVRSFRDSHDLFDGIFRCYAVVIACFVVLAETEWDFILKFSKVLEYWAGRGMLQIFVAVMTKAFPDYMVQKKDLLHLQTIASYLLLACGVIYVISGLLCIGFLKRARQQMEISREQAVKDLEEIERRREDLKKELKIEIIEKLSQIQSTMMAPPEKIATQQAMLEAVTSSQIHRCL